MDKTFYLVYASPHITVSGLCFVTIYKPNTCHMYLRLSLQVACCLHLIFFSPSQMQKEVEVELHRLVGQEGSIHTKMLALQRMGYSLF